MRVIATKRGYDGVVVREEGAEFDMPDGAKGSWFDPVKEGRGKGRQAPTEAPLPELPPGAGPLPPPGT